jgi:MFS family permease
LADKLEKTRWAVLICSVLLNLTSLASGFAVNFWTLLIPRLMYALASAALESIFTRLIGLYFPPGSRGYAQGIYFISIYVGSALSSLTLVTSAGIGWRFTYIGFGAVGVVASIVIGVFWPEYEFNEADRAAIENSRKQQLFKEFKTLLCTNKTLNITVLAFAVRYSAGFSRGFFEAIYFTKQFPDQESTYSFIVFGAILAAPLGPVLGGYFSDVKEQINPKWRPYICRYCLASITSFAAIPLYLAMYTTSSFTVAMICLSFVYIIGETYISVGSAMMLNVSPMPIRAFGIL